MFFACLTLCISSKKCKRTKHFSYFTENRRSTKHFKPWYQHQIQTFLIRYLHDSGDKIDTEWRTRKKRQLVNGSSSYQVARCNIALFKDKLLQIPKLMNYLLKNSVCLHVNLAFKQQQQKKSSDWHYKQWFKNIALSKKQNPICMFSSQH